MKRKIIEKAGFESGRIDTYNMDELIKLTKFIKPRNISILILTREGYVYLFGENEYGKLGLENYISRNIPTLISNIRDIVSVSSGCSFSCY